MNCVYLRQKYHQKFAIYAKQCKHNSLAKCHYSVQILDVIFIKYFWYISFLFTRRSTEFHVYLYMGIRHFIFICMEVNKISFLFICGYIRFGWLLLHSGHSWLFDAKPSLYVYIKYILFGLVGFCGFSTTVGYLMSNPLYTCILSMYDLVRLVLWHIKHCRLINVKPPCHVVYDWEERNKKFPLLLRVWINRPPKTDR